MVGTTQLLVVIAGGVVAGLEAHMGFRAPAGRPRRRRCLGGRRPHRLLRQDGGFADEQAYVAAADIEAAAGASVQERPFDPVLQ
jgi:hypothetical protein